MWQGLSFGVVGALLYIAGSKSGNAELWRSMLIGVLGGLGVFLYGMRVMSRGLESVGGERMRAMLQKVTKNPIGGILTGLLVTCVIQSSSATTVMMVSLVHAGFLKLTQAIGIVMGANIGTTLTGWLVATLGFKFKISNFALPAITLGVILIFTGSGRRRGLWGDILVGFGLLFLGLSMMKSGVKPLRSSPEIIKMLGSYSASSGITALLMAVAIGTLITVVIQSSSATMALTMTLAMNGSIDFVTAAALILGENIGTTITANLAAIGTDVAARRAARAHFFFNSFGVLWAVLLFYPFVSMIDWIVPGAMTNAAKVPDHMAAFHTIFNITNTLLFFPFIGMLANLVTKLVPGDTAKSSERHIMYLDFGSVSTPALAMTAASKELQRMAETCTEMFDAVIKLFNQPDQDATTLVKQVKEYEERVDALEREIVEYLTSVGQSRISAEDSQRVAAGIDVAHNLEKIGDHCESLLRMLRDKYHNKQDFSEEATQQIHDIAQNARQLLALITENLIGEGLDIMEQAEALERSIDSQRWEMRKAHVQRLTEGKVPITSGLLFIDMLSHFEKIGDQSFNIAQHISGKR